MKKINLLLLITLLFQIHFLYAQDSQKKVPFFIPKSTAIYASSDFRAYLKSGKNISIDHINIGATFTYSNHIQMNIVNRTSTIGDINQYKFTDINLQYVNDFKSKKSLLKYGSNLDIKIGKLQWFPSLVNEQLIIENASAYINPPQVYGGSIISKTLLTKDSAASLNIEANSGDLLHHTVSAQVYNLNINYTKIIKWDLGVSAQIGKAFGSSHIVNFAYLMYQPKTEDLQLDFRVGKLQTIDETPYGIHIGFKRTFKTLVLGGYIEKRMNQNTNGVIAGFSWGLTGNSKLVKLISNFNVIYDFNSSTIWMWLPIIKFDIKNK